MKDFSVIIVTYNSASDILECLNSINQYTSNYSIEIIIIDNRSQDSTCQLIQEHFAKARLFTLNSNIGYAAAANIGSTYSSGKYLLFCNPDISFTDDIFKMAITHFENKDVGCVTPRIISENNVEGLYAFRFPQERTILSIIVRKILTISTKQALQIHFNSSEKIIECQWVLGACLMIPAQTFNIVEKFDETFFLNYEEIDLCKRLRNQNFKILADRTYSVKHKDGQSKKSMSKSKLLYTRIRSEISYNVKYSLNDNYKRKRR